MMKKKQNTLDKRAIENKKRKKVVLNGCDEPCPIERGMRLIGGKWKGSILWHLQEGPLRFNELSRQLSGASKKIITERLKEMESYGLIKRKVISDRPIAISYELTAFGKSALLILKDLKKWSEKNAI